MKCKARAIFLEAALNVAARRPASRVHAGDHGAAHCDQAAELDSSFKDRVDRSGWPEAVFERRGTGEKLGYLIGTMIELPRAVHYGRGRGHRTAAFFSFGTNDLTQTAFGISRDDSAKYLTEYTQKGILKTDPFVSIDVEGVGELVRIGVERGQATRPDIKLGICGEHGGDPASVTFCNDIGLDYVSCSPFRVPIARLAAAQAAVAKAES